MPLVPMRPLLDAALRGGYAVGAFNVNNMEQVQAIMAAATKQQSPVIVQASRGALKYSSLGYLRHLMLAAAELNPALAVVMHLDHGNSFATVETAVGLGFTSVMIDGSLKEDGKTPSDYAYNVGVTRQVVAYAHARGVTVEGEIGTLGGIEDGHGSGQTHLADPAQAEQFIKDTGVDALAVAVGTSHGAYKFGGEVKLALEIIREIRRRCPETPLVMHGSSSVPPELVAVVNKYGGKMPNARGVPLESLRQAIQLGVCKINVDTDCRIAMTGAIRKVFAETPNEFDPRGYLGPAREAMAEVVAARLAAFGSAGKLPAGPVPTLAEMQQLYAAGAKPARKKK